MSAVMRWGGALLLVAVLTVAAVAKVSPDPGFFCSSLPPFPPALFGRGQMVSCTAAHAIWGVC